MQALSPECTSALGSRVECIKATNTTGKGSEAGYLRFLCTFQQVHPALVVDPVSETECVLVSQGVLEWYGNAILDVK